MSVSQSCILLVEDDPNDVFFLQMAFEQARINNPIRIVNDGRQAIDYLSAHGRYADRRLFPWPGLVLLDLNLPLISGIDVLKWIRTRPECAFLLVLVLTSSREQKDIEDCHRFGARSFLLKPISLNERLELARLIKEYWLEMNVLPAPQVQPVLPRLPRG